MPKGRKKDRRARGAKNHTAAASEEEYDTCDSASVISGVSDIPSVEEENGVDEISQQENFEDKLKDCIDGLTQKSVKGRVENLTSLKAALSRKYMYEFILNRKLTLTDSLERCLKKGKGEEQAVAAACSVLICVQLGVDVDSEDVYKQLKPTLTTITADNSAPAKGRSACAVALAQLTFLASQGIEQVIEVLKTLAGIFKGSYLKGDKTPPSYTPDVAALHASALVGWSLLLTIAPPHMVAEVCDSIMGRLPELLESADVDLRITTGETIALLYELMREQDEDFEGPDMFGLLDRLKELASDSNKYRAKKDRRHQRSSFRDVIRAIEEGDAPSYTVQFGHESLLIDSWVRKRQYDSLCQALGPGMNTHLQENELVRDIFGLGSPIPVGTKPPTKASKFERHMYNAAAFKARTKARSKFRDKRSQFVNGDS